MKIKVDIVNNSGFDLPVYATEGSAAMDIKSTIDIRILPNTTKLVPTGLFIAVPKGYELQIRPRSGLSIKCNSTIPNSPATIDSDYRGEIFVGLHNLDRNLDLAISKGERVAQILLKEVPVIEWNVVKTVEELGATERGAGGLGSTGR